MERITTLNEDKGCVISDLEALFVVIEKLFHDKLEEKPKAGITLAKGKPNERKIRYKEASKLFTELRAYFELKGAVSIGNCQTCTLWKNNGSGTGFYGTCTKNNTSKHAFDNCLSHSTKGGGYGV